MLNSFHLEGYLASPPVEKVGADGRSLFQFVLAVPRDPSRFRKRRVSDFLRLTAYGKDGEIIQKYVSVGQHLVVRGCIHSYKQHRKGGDYLQFELIVEKSYFTRADAVLSSEEIDFAEEERLSDSAEDTGEVDDGGE